jgi:hypothetical protein
MYRISKYPTLFISPYTLLYMYALGELHTVDSSNAALAHHRSATSVMVSNGEKAPSHSFIAVVTWITTLSLLKYYLTLLLTIMPSLTLTLTLTLTFILLFTLALRRKSSESKLEENESEDLSRLHSLPDIVVVNAEEGEVEGGKYPMERCGWLYKKGGAIFQTWSKRWYRI